MSLVDMESIPLWWRAKTGFHPTLKFICEKKYSVNINIQFLLTGFKALYTFQKKENCMLFFSEKLIIFCLKISLDKKSNNLSGLKKNICSDLRKLVLLFSATQFHKRDKSVKYDNIQVSESCGFTKKEFWEVFFFFGRKCYKSFEYDLSFFDKFKRKRSYVKLISLFLELAFHQGYFCSKPEQNDSSLTKLIFKILSNRYLNKSILFLKYLQSIFLWQNDKWNQKRLFAFSIFDKFLHLEWIDRLMLYKQQNDYVKKFFNGQSHFTTDFMNKCRRLSRCPASDRLVKMCVSKLSYLSRDFYKKIRNRSKQLLLKLFQKKQFSSEIYQFICRKIINIEFCEENLHTKMQILSKKEKTVHPFFCYQKEEFLDYDKNIDLFLTQCISSETVKVSKKKKKEICFFGHDKISMLFSKKNLHNFGNMGSISDEKQIFVSSLFSANLVFFYNINKYKKNIRLQIRKLYNRFINTYFTHFLGQTGIKNYGCSEKDQLSNFLYFLCNNSHSKKNFFSRKAASLFLNLNGSEIKAFIAFDLSFPFRRNQKTINENINIFLKKLRHEKNFLRKRLNSYIFTLVFNFQTNMAVDVLRLVKYIIFTNPIECAFENVNFFVTLFTCPDINNAPFNRVVKMHTNHWLLLNISRILINITKKEEKTWFAFWEFILFFSSDFSLNSFLFVNRLIQELNLKIQHFKFRKEVKKKFFRLKLEYFNSFFHLAQNQKIFCEKVGMKIRTTWRKNNNKEILIDKKDVKMSLNKISQKIKKFVLKKFVFNLSQSIASKFEETVSHEISCFLKLVSSHEDIARQYFKFYLYLMNKVSKQETLSEMIVSLLDMEYNCPNILQENFKEICTLFITKPFRSAKKMLILFFHFILKGTLKGKRDFLTFILNSSCTNLDICKLKKTILTTIFLNKKELNSMINIDFVPTLIRIRNINEIIYREYILMVKMFSKDITSKDAFLTKIFSWFKIFKQKKDLRKLVACLWLCCSTEKDYRRVTRFFVKNSQCLTDIKSKDDLIRMCFYRNKQINLKNILQKTLERLIIN